MAKSQIGALRKSLLKVQKLNRAVVFKIFLRCEHQECKSNTKGLVLGLYSGDKEPKLTETAERFDERISGKITTLINESGLTGQLGKGKMFTNLDEDYSFVSVVGLGKEGIGFNCEEALDEGLENVRIAAAVGARSMQLQGCKEVHVDYMEFPEQAAEGSALAVWRYNVNKHKANRTAIPKLDLYGSRDTEAWTRGLFKAESQNLARRLTDAPANLMTPSIFAQATVDALCPCGVTVEVRALDWIENVGLYSFLAVAKGACEPPLLLEISYCGTSPDEPPALLLGNGCTFNSGGLCLEPRPDLKEGRGANSGAAVVVATVRAAAALSLPINVTAVIPLCENMPSGMAVKPGDVVKLLNGMTLGVPKTDMAASIMLADPLLYSQATYKPKVIVQVASLGQGIRAGLGASATGLWTNNSYLWAQFKRAGSLTGDRTWRMPLWKYFEGLITPNLTYDLCSRGKGPADSCLAAALLYHLVPCVDWVHLDTRGTGLVAKEGVPPYLLSNRMSGRPTRTIVQFLYQLACKEKCL